MNYEAMIEKLELALDKSEQQVQELELKLIKQDYKPLMLAKKDGRPYLVICARSLAPLPYVSHWCTSREKWLIGYKEDWIDEPDTAPTALGWLTNPTHFAEIPFPSENVFAKAFENERSANTA